MIAHTHVRLQASEVDCAATCLGIILQYYGDSHSNLDLRKYCAVGRSGATVAQIKRGAEQLGHSCTPLKKGIKSLARMTRPVILHWDMRHFVVFEGIVGNSVWINDPAHGRRKLNLEEFNRHFTGICLDIEPKKKTKTKAKLDILAAFMQLRPAGQSFLGKAFSVGLFSALLIFSSELLFGGIARVFFDYVVEYQLTSWGYVLAAIGIPILLVRGWIKHLQNIQLQAQSANLSIQMKRNFLDHLHKRPVTFFEAHFAGELFSRLQDFNRSLYFLLRTVHGSGGQIVILLASSLALWLLSPLLALVHLLPRLGLIVWQSIVSLRAKEAEIRESEENARHKALQAQRASGYVRFYATGMQSHLLVTCLPPLARRQTARVNLAKHMAGTKAFDRSLNTLSLPLTTFVGSYLLIQSQLTYGGFMLASALAVLLSSELLKLSETIREYIRLRPIFHRVAETITELEASPTNNDNGLLSIAPTKDTSPIYEVHNLGFGYNGYDIDLFHNINFSIKSGEIVNIAGESGCGKSTLFDLLSGLRKPLKGAVLFEGSPLKNFAPVGYVFADDSFIQGSLIDFIANGQPANLEKMTELVRLVELWNRLGFFLNSDNSERLEEQGLSQGEIQRLLLAQALYHDDKCVLFDEAFNHLSFEQSGKILEALRKRGTTMIMATHRPEIQTLCDRNIYLTQPTAPFAQSSNVVAPNFNLRKNIG